MKYIKYILIVVCLFLMGLFIFKNTNKIYLNNPRINYKELENYVIENTDCLIYVTNINKKIDMDIENIIYLYLTKDEENSFKNTYGISSFPSLVYFSNGYMKEYINYNSNELEEFINRNGL